MSGDQANTTISTLGRLSPIPNPNNNSQIQPVMLVHLEPKSSTPNRTVTMFDGVDMVESTEPTEESTSTETNKKWVNMTSSGEVQARTVYIPDSIGESSPSLPQTIAVSSDHSSPSTITGHASDRPDTTLHQEYQENRMGDDSSVLIVGEDTAAPNDILPMVVTKVTVPATKTRTGSSLVVTKERMFKKKLKVNCSANRQPLPSTSSFGNRTYKMRECKVVVDALSVPPHKQIRTKNFSGLSRHKKATPRVSYLKQSRDECGKWKKDNPRKRKTSSSCSTSVRETTEKRRKNGQ